MQIPNREKPLIPITAKRELLASIESAVSKALDKVQLKKSCLDCHHFIEEAELCRRFNTRPPARVLVEACKDFTEK